jgi:type I restriction enzyme, R subunit
MNFRTLVGHCACGKNTKEIRTEIIRFVFYTGKALTANQIQFVNLVIDYLTQGGWMSPAQLYESPFTDFSPRGVEGVFDSAQVGQLLSVLDEVRQTAVA